MATKTVVITGDEEVKRRLQAMGATAQAKLALAMMAGALVIQNDAKARVRKKTGNLARSIHTEQLPGNMGVQVGTDVVYGLAQEYGRPDLPNYGFTPYMRPAVDQNLSRVAFVIGTTFGKLLAP
jgi:hypothetical protein